MDPGAFFDTPGTPEGASIVEGILFESKQPLWQVSARAHVGFIAKTTVGERTWRKLLFFMGSPDP